MVCYGADSRRGAAVRSAAMRAEVTLHIDAPPDRVWGLVSDITKMGEFSPEVIEAEWIDGATGPVVGRTIPGPRKTQRELAGPLLDHMQSHREPARRGVRVRSHHAGTADEHLALRFAPPTMEEPTSPSHSTWATTSSQRSGTHSGGSCGSDVINVTCSAPSNGSRRSQSVRRMASDPATLLSLVNPSFGASGVKTADRTLMSHSRSRTCSY